MRRNDTSAQIISVVLILLAVIIVLLFIIGALTAAKNCQDKGGSYVQTPTGYACVEQVK